MNLILKDVRHEAPDAISFIFKPEEPLAWKAGQYLRVRLPHSDKDERGEERYFSIATAPYERGVMITTRLAEEPSSFKRQLERMPTGETLKAIGPEGDFVVNDPTEEMVFLAGGIGITPFRSILFDLDHRNIPIHVTLLYSSHDNHFIYKDELESLMRRHEGLKVKYFISPQRINEEDIRSVSTDIAKPTFFISGPEPMVEYFEKLLASIGVPPSHRRTDYFQGYEWK